MGRKTLFNRRAIAIGIGTTVMEFYSGGERLGLISEYSMDKWEFVPKS